MKHRAGWQQCRALLDLTSEAGQRILASADNTDKTMTQIQKFMLAHPFGFIKDTELKTVIAMNRMQLLLVRCGNCRFIAPAQDVQQIMDALKAAGDYVRDVSFTAQDMDKARQAQAAEPANLACRHDPRLDFNENDCGGVFDGHGVISDADPGL